MSDPWVIIPTYDEKKNISRLITEIFRLTIPNLSVLVVDDNSPDGTAACVRRLQKSWPTLHLVVRQRKQGLGRAYINGFEYALKHGATAMVQMDADFSHNPKDIPRLLKKLDKQHDLVIGSRYCHGISVVNWPLRRLLLSTAANLYARTITGLPIRDTTGGFRAWRATALSVISLSSINADGYGFQIETLYRAWKKKLRITELPIIFTERREGQSKMSKAIMWESLWLVWRLRIFGR